MVSILTSRVTVVLCYNIRTRIRSYSSGGPTVTIAISAVHGRVSSTRRYGRVIKTSRRIAFVRTDREQSLNEQRRFPMSPSAKSQNVISRIYPYIIHADEDA